MDERAAAPVSAAGTADGAPVRLPFVSDMADYWSDTWQRSVLFLDVMRERGDQYRDHATKATPHVLRYEAELVVDGRTLPRPVNYLLVRILPTDDQPVDPAK